MNKKISVIIPTFNRNTQLKRCLFSISKQIQKPNEVIVVDNSPNHNAQNVISKIAKNNILNIRYISELKRGTTFARNRGINEANNELIAFIDDDCIAAKNWIQELLSTAKSHRESFIMGQNLNGIKNNISSALEFYSANCFTQCFIFTFLGESYSSFLDTKNCLLRKSIIIKNNLYFDEQHPPFSIAEDTIFSYNLIKKRIPIHYNQNIIVYHYGNKKITDHFRYQLNKGVAHYFVKLFVKENHNDKFIKASISNELELLKLEKRIKTKILKNKTFLFKILFNFLLYFDAPIAKCGYFQEMIANFFRRV